MSAWYVVHCQPRGEQKALFHLKRQGYAAYLPVCRKTRRHARRTEEISVPLFPRYLFVRLDMKTDHWLPIRSTVGVSQIVTRGDTPAPMPDDIMNTIMAREDEDGFVLLNEADRFKKGDSIQVTEGPLAEQVGLFERIADDHRVVVLLELLGRPVKVRLPLDAIGAAA